MTLEKMEYGDDLMYCDSGSELGPQMPLLFKRLQKNDVVAFMLYQLAQEWTKGDLYVAMNATFL